MGVAAVVAAVGAREPNRTVDSAEGAMKPNRTVDVVESTGVAAEEVLEDLELLAELGLGAVLTSSGNCKVGLVSPSLTAVGKVSWRALCRSAVVGRKERLSAARSETSSVAPPKL